MKHSSDNKNYSCLHCQRQFCASQIANAHTYIVNKQKDVFESVDDSNGEEVCQVCERSVEPSSLMVAFKGITHWIHKVASWAIHAPHNPAKAYH
ncbi:MAG: hypothetical protein U0Y10_06770 [Spirosomataceae bacterium]